MCLLPKGENNASDIFCKSSLAREFNDLNRFFICWMIVDCMITEYFARGWSWIWLDFGSVTI